MAPATDSLGAFLLRNRRVVRSPIWLYRHNFGWLFGSRMLMLEHVGRTSGEARFVCLEVVGRPAADRIVVVSGFGREAHWYRNLLAEPRCAVSIGRRRQAAATARFMTSAESHDALATYQREHPQAWAHLRGVIEQAVGHPVTELPLVELTLTS